MNRFRRAIGRALALAPLASACARGTRTDAAAARIATLASASTASDSAAPCWGLGGPPDDATAWDRVDAGVMTFCVPPGGDVTGRVWHTAGVRLAWGVRGQVGPSCFDPSVFAYRAPSMPSELGPGEAGVSQGFREKIGGMRASVWRFRHGSFHRASAHWLDAPYPWLCVESEIANDDQLPLRILRSVRFTGR